MTATLPALGHVTTQVLTATQVGHSFSSIFRGGSVIAQGHVTCSRSLNGIQQTAEVRLELWSSRPGSSSLLGTLLFCRALVAADLWGRCYRALVSCGVTSCQRLLPGVLPRSRASAAWRAGWEGSAVTLHFSPLISASLMTSVSPRCSFKLDPRRNFKANSSISDVHGTCHCLCYL